MDRPDRPGNTPFVGEENTSAGWNRLLAPSVSISPHPQQLGPFDLAAHPIRSIITWRYGSPSDCTDSKNSLKAGICLQSEELVSIVSVAISILTLNGPEKSNCVLNFNGTVLHKWTGFTLHYSENVHMSSVIDRNVPLLNVQVQARLDI